MTIPQQLAKSNTEHAHQTALFAYMAVARQHGFEVAENWIKTGIIDKSNSKNLLALQWLHAIPNGGSRGDTAKTRKIRGAQLKAEGVRSGVPDIFLPWPVAQWHGLYIEMKKPSLRPKSSKAKGGLSTEQIAFKEYALGLDYGFIVCYDWIEAKEAIRNYIEWKG